MKKTFLSYKYSNENKENLDKVIKVCSILKSFDFKNYCSIFDEEKFRLEKWTGKQIMQKVFEKIDDSDIILFLILSEVESPGTILELGYCLAKKKKLLLLIKNNVNNNIFRRQIDEVINFENIDDLNSKLKSKYNMI
jgi:nucleoside 2-deoxyribosyltransferase